MITLIDKKSTKKHDITVLSSDYTNFFSSTNLQLEKEKWKKWIFEIQNNVLNFNIYIIR